MRGRTTGAWVGGIAAATLALAACSSGSSTTPSDNSGGNPSGSAGGASGGSMIYAGCKPQNPLIPSNTQETCGGDVIQSLFTGLIRYGAEDAKSINEMAESITSDDNVTWTIKIKPDWTFQDGSPITAQTFVDSWNYAAWPGNAQLNAYFFENIKGFSYGDDKDGDGTVSPKEAASVPKKLEGLKVVDDTTFTATLTSAYGSWPARLGYSAFVPMPPSFFKDPAAFGKKPVGNGPFKLVSSDPNTSIKVTAWDGYKGSDKPKIKDIDFKVYQSLDSAYADLISGNADFMQQVPTTALAGDKWKTDLGDGQWLQKPVGVFQSMTFPPEKVNPEYANKDLRHAISMAIDREAVIKVAFEGGRQPADGWVSPVVDGYKKDVCGDFCKYNPDMAKQLLAKTGFKGPIQIAYNADGGHKEWVDATCASISGALGIQCQGKPYPDFATFRSLITGRKMQTIFRSGWQMDYPNIENFLIPLYKTDAGSNDGDYSNPQFDKLTNEAATKQGEEATSLYQQAEALLPEDMPAVPLWFGEAQAGWSKNVNNVQLTPFGTLDYSSITSTKSG